MDDISQERIVSPDDSKPVSLKKRLEEENFQKNNEMESEGSESSPHSRHSRTRSLSPFGSQSENSDIENVPSSSGTSERATPLTPCLNRNNSRSRSQSLDQHKKGENFCEGDDSRSQSPNLQIDDIPKSTENSESENDSDAEAIDKNMEKSTSRPNLRVSHSESHSEHSKSLSVSPKTDKKKIFENEIEKIAYDETIKKDMDEKVNAEDIFGDADDISISGDEKNGSASNSPVASPRRRSHSASSSRSGSRSHSDDTMKSRSRSRSRSLIKDSSPQKVSAKENDTEMVQETRIDVEIPRIVTNLGKEINFVKLPNFLSVEMRPFDAETYEDEIDEEETMDEEGRQRIKLKVSNTIRWREFMNNEGEMIKESNARFVRWSDGSQTLHLGNEMFDVYKQPLHGDHNHMFIRQGTGLQGQAVFRTKLTFRPHSTESFTHKKMTMSLADRSQKTSGIKILTQVGKDPTADRLYYLKKEEEKLRQAARSAHKPQSKKKKSIDTRNDANFAYQNDDGSDDENVISLNAIKKQYKKGTPAAASSTVSEQKASAIYSSDDDEDSDFERRRKKINKTKIIRALRDSDSDDVASETADSKKISDDNTNSDNSD